MVRRTSSLLLAGSLAVAAGCGADRTAPLPVENAAPLAGKLAASAGFVTSQPAQAEVLLPQAELWPIISVGDIIPGTTEAWAPTPDGLGAYLENGVLNLFANHELSSSGVRSSNGGPTIAYARVSKLAIDPRTRSVLGGRYVEDGSQQLQRLCSATWVDGVEGLPTGYFLTGEETLGTTNGSVVMAYDKQGNKTPLPHLGAFAHENQIVVPGYPGKVLGIGLDDASGQSELYMYIAKSEQDFIQGNGKLYVYRTDATSPAGTPLHSGNMVEGQKITGTFVEVSDPADLSTPATQRAANLQRKVDALGAMPFVRIEDGDYDKNSPQTPAIYFVDTGSPSVRGRSQVGADCFGVCDLAGSLYRMQFERNDPTRASLTLMSRSKGAASGWASPDNIATTASSIMIQEDPAYDGFDGSRPPAIWNLKLVNDGKQAINPRKVVQATQEKLIPGAAGKCIDALGQCWELSGIISTEKWMGKGSWLFVVQAHTLPFSVTTNGVTSLYPNENGQLLFLRVPGT
ncbi:MAG: DUF839 domain-containing protein [Gemmatimonadaceae bacterium]